MIYKVAELAGLDGKSWYKGFSIHKKVDGRYIYDDPRKDYYTARLWSSDSILVGYPSGTYEHYMYPESFKSEVEKSIWVAMDEARNKYFEDTSRHTEYTLLKFTKPSDSDSDRDLGFKMSAREIHGNTDGDETELELLYFPISNFHKGGAGQIESYMCVWNVVRLDIAPGKRGKPDAKPMSKAAKQQYERQLKKQMQANEAAKAAGHATPPYPDVQMSS